jgi:hypothetical protein
VAEGEEEDAKFTPRLQIRSRIGTALDQYLDPEKVAGAYTDIRYYKHDGKVYVEVLFHYTDGQKIGPRQRKQFLVNKDFTLTPIKKQGMAEGSKHNQQDLDDVADWMNTTPDKLSVEVKQESIEKFIKQIREMYGTYDEFPEDEDRTNRILKLLKRGAKPLPIYVEAGDPHLFVMEGRHRMVAFWLAEMKTIPVAYVSINSQQGVAEDKGMTQYNAFKREWRAKHGSDAKVPGYDSKEYNAYWWRQGDKQQDNKKQGVAEGSEEFNTVKTLPYKATQLLGGKYPVAFAIEVLCPDQSVVSMIQNKIGRAYQVERDNSIEGNGIGIEIVSRRFEGGQTAQAAYDQLLDFIEQNGGQFNSSTQVTIYKQKPGMAEQQLDEKCWDGYQQQGMKNKSGRQVPNCVPVTEELTTDQQFDMIEDMVEQLAESHGVDSDVIWEDFESVDDHELYETAAWRRKEGKSARGGLNAKGVASYRRENPGSKLQTAVTTKPSKLKPGSKAAKRRKSFCARMGGVKGPMKKPNGKPTRKALALRKWNC